MKKSEDHVYSARKTTELEVKFPGVGVAIQIWGPESKRKRHSIALAITRRIEPLFSECLDKDDDHERGSISHLDDDSLNQYKSMLRGLRLKQAQRTDTPEQRLGFEIRMRRLELGCSQERLARMAEIDRAHLSRIEQGKCRVKPETLGRINAHLGPHSTPHLHKGPLSVPDPNEG